MATLPALVPFQVPNVNLGDTFTQMARLSAYDAQRRSSELEQEEKRTKLDRDRLWRSTIAGAFPTTDPRAPVGLNAMAPQAQPPPQAPPTGGLAGPQMISQGPSTMGAPGMASQVPVNQPMDVNPQTGEWSTPGGLSAPPASPMAPGGLTQPQGGMPPQITALAQPEAPGQPPLQGGGLTVAQPGQSALTGQPGASTGTLASPQPQRPLQASVPGLMPMPQMEAVQRAFAIDPEKTSTWYSAYLTQRGKQLDEVDRNNKLVYQVTSAMRDNPEYYKQGLEYLREQGVPVPKNMPAEYNPALVKFHNDVSRTRLDPLQEAQRENQLALAALNRDKVKTEELKRQGVRSFLAGEEGQSAPAQAGGREGTGGGPATPGTPPTVDTARWQSLLQLVDETADKEGVPRALVRAVIKQESNWDINAEGDGGKAKGWFQLHEGAAKDAGIDPAKRHDAEQNILGGVRYLKQKLTQAGGDEDKALRLYNGGGDPNYVQNVRRWMTERPPSGESAGTATTSAASGRIAELRQQIAAKERRARGASVTEGMEGAATQLRSEITDLQQELARLEEPGRELAKQQVLLPGQKAVARAGEETKAEMERATREEIDAINMGLPEDQRIPYGTTREEIRTKKLVGGIPIPDKGNEELIGRATIVKQLGELKTKFGDLPTGPIQGRLNQYREILGVDLTDEQVAYSTLLNSVRNRVVNVLSGAAVSPDEARRILAELPNEKTSPQAFKGRLETALKIAEDVYKIRAQYYKRKGHSMPDSLMTPYWDESPPGATGSASASSKDALLNKYTR